MRSTVPDTFSGCVGMITMFVVTIIISAVVGGWLFSVLWAWFVVPVFDLPYLTIPQAIGLTLIVSLFNVRNRQTDKSKTSTELMVESLALSILLPAIVFPIAFIVRLFV